jgi:hypothetical protein
MAKQVRASDQPDPKDESQDDVEGHSMLLNPTVSRDLTSSRSREIDRQVRDQQRARDAKAQQHKAR